ncbi:MAG: hypothetical protein AAF982_06340 [Pseudomonadota bacterium]
MVRPLPRDPMIRQANRYLDDTYLFKCTTKVIETGRDHDGQGLWVALEENIAHPQGGGQPSDRVTLNGSRAEPVFAPDGFGAMAPVRLRLGEVEAPVEGATVDIEIDEDSRCRHAALHTGGHLLHWVLQEFGWQATKGNHFPGESRVEFRAKDGEPPAPWDEIAETVAARCRALLAEAPRVTAWMEGTTRLTRIGETENVPCAGTHVDHLGRIDAFALIGGKVKKGILKLRYDATHIAL